MSSHPAISRELSGDIADDFSKLKNEVLSWCAEWCAPSGDAGAGGKVWSDFNAHDPGVQIVEVICYALTELAHRARVPVLSLLQHERGGIAWNEGAFFSPPDILPMAPLTAADYQKLLLDRFHQLSQVSFTAGENGHHLIQLHLHEVPDVEGEKVRHLVEELLLQQRNLGERFTVQLASGTPLTGKPLVFASIADRQKDGCSLANILTGPLLMHGAIADEFLPLVNAAGQAPPSSRLRLPPGSCVRLAGRCLSLIPHGCVRTCWSFAHCSRAFRGTIPSGPRNFPLPPHRCGVRRCSSCAAIFCPSSN
ncbi:hypothetical protein [Prosthecobacter sp.]|uniref:hypothetical protein n=1 Tax=Prosthecobacter sp. TaxID=1965333 RepID=UPI0037CB580F